MKPIDQVIAGEQSRRRCVVVSEWGGIDVYVAPVTTLDQNSVNDRNYRTADDRAIGLVIQKAQDKDGKRLFEWGDFTTLQRYASTSALNKVLDAALGIELPPPVTSPVDDAKARADSEKVLADAEVQLEGNPPSASV